MKLKVILLSSAFLAAGTLISQFSHADNIDTDQQSVLDEVVTTGIRPTLDAPKTGEFLFRPVLYKRGRGSGRVRTIDFFFSPIEEQIDGTARLYKEQNRDRYRVSVNVPVVDPTGTRFRLQDTDKIDLGTHRLELPGGAYALSEIRYSFIDQRLGGTAGILTNQTNTRSYCLTEETYAFDVTNGKTEFFGGLALTPFPSNSAHFRRHHPVIGVDNRLELVSGPAKREIESIEPMGFSLTSFEAEEGLCGNRQYQVAALAP